VVVERIEREGINAVHFSVKVINGSAKAIFLESRPALKMDARNAQQLEGLYLEEWQDLKGWMTVVPCRDVFASDPVSLRSGGEMSQEFSFELPLSSVCKKPVFPLTGNFRFRVDYFGSSQAVRTYIRQMNSLGPEPRPPASAVSEPFEISQVKE